MLVWLCTKSDVSISKYVISSLLLTLPLSLLLPPHSLSLTGRGVCLWFLQGRLSVDGVHGNVLVLHNPRQLDAQWLTLVHRWSSLGRVWSRQWRLCTQSQQGIYSHTEWSLNLSEWSLNLSEWYSYNHYREGRVRPIIHLDYHSNPHTVLFYMSSNFICALTCSPKSTYVVMYLEGI